MNTIVKRASVQQEGIWFHAMSHSFAYWNFAVIRCFSGQLHPAFLKEAFDEVMKRHSALRTRFVLKGAELFQLVDEEYEQDQVFKVCQSPLRNEDEITAFIKEEVKSLLRHNWNPELEPPFYFRAFFFGDLVYLVAVVNHLVADNTSTQIFWNELAVFYNRRFDTKGPLPETALHYYEFAEMQRMMFKSTEYARQRSYWEQKINSPLPSLDLSFCRSRQQPVVVHKDLDLPAQLAADARTAAMKGRVLFSAVFQLAYFLLLHRYSGQHTITMGNIFNGRGIGKKKNDKTIGLFANRLLNVLEMNEDDTVAGLMSRMNADIVSSYSNSDVPYEEVFRMYQEKHRHGSSPLFNAVFNVLKNTNGNAGFSDMHEWEVPTEVMGFTYDNQYALYLVVIDDLRSVKLRIAIRCEPAMQGMLDLLLQNYLSLLEVCIYNPRQKLRELADCAQLDKTLMQAFNDTYVEISPSASPVETIAGHARTSPQRAAILYGKDVITYSALDEAADMMSARLYQAGLRPGLLAAVLLKRRPSLIVSLLATLRLGAAFLPLDPSLPASRLAFMCEDAKPHLVITEDELLELLPANVPAFNIHEAETMPVQLPAHEEDHSLPAYVIYTSGSTGQPKGVVIPRGAVVNFTTAMRRIVDFEKRVLCVTSVSFDIFLVEWLLPLYSGGTIVLADETAREDPFMLAHIITAHRVEVAQFTPSHMKLLLHESAACLVNITDLLIGGEAFPAGLQNKIWQQFNGRIYNFYGPTETTVWSTVKQLNRHDEDITIGAPLANTAVFILNGEQGICGVGIWGEVAIAGAGLATGYLNRQALSSEKFIQLDETGQRLYKTGDAGRWLPGGEIELAGRRDDQLKVRGYRIEPGEIEYHIKTFPGIKDAVVVAAANELKAFYISGTKQSALELRNYLRQFLPGHMIPSAFVRKTAFPVTHNGKTDRRALQAEPLEKSDASLSEQAAVNVDPVLLAIWTDVLQLNAPVTADQLLADFFNYGGHSLKALYMLEEIHKKMNVLITMREFFKRPTLSFLQERVAQAGVQAH